MPAFEPECLFCKIAAKEIPSKVTYEDEHAVAFLDIHPRAEGHTVVIPKYHAATLIDLPNDEAAALVAAVKRVDEKLVAEIKPDGMTIGINQGRAGGQEIDHLHVHLIPRSHGDGGGSIQSIVPTKKIG